MISLSLIQLNIRLRSQ